MKHTFFAFIAMVLMSNVLRAQQSNLIIFTEQGEQISIVLNGVKQNATPQTNIKVTGLNEGGYKLKVIFADGKAPDVDKTIYIQPAQEVTVSVKKNKDGQYVIRPVSMIDIAAAPAPPAGETVIVYSAIPPPVQQSTTITTITTGGDPNATDVNIGADVNGVGVNVNMRVNDGSTTTQQTTTTTTYSTGINNDAPPPAYVPGYTGPIGCEMPMSPGDFESAKSTISSKTFESSKDEIARHIAESNCLTATQVKEIMQLFEYETTKLGFAKFAYHHTYDKGNYFKVNSAFGFESSTSELNDYIKGH